MADINKRLIRRDTKRVNFQLTKKTRLEIERLDKNRVQIRYSGTNIGILKILPVAANVVILETAPYKKEIYKKKKDG